MVDHAHGLGLNLYDTLESIDILTASLSKALGTQGGIILCSNTVKQLLVNLARPSFIQVHFRYLTYTKLSVTYITYAPNHTEQLN